MSNPVAVCALTMFRAGRPRAGLLATSVVIACGVAGATQAPPAANLPAQLDDREFWALVTGLSEPDGDFPDENYVSNESGYPAVMARLQERTPRGGVYLGVGPEQNFTYIAALEPAMAFVLDIRRQNAMLLLMYKAVFALSADREAFVSRLFSRRSPGLPRDVGVDDLFAAFRDVPADPALFDDTLGRVLDHLTVQRGFPLPEADRAAIRKVLAAFRDDGPAIMYVFRDTVQRHPTYAEMMTVTDSEGRHWSYLATHDSFTRVKEMHRRNLVVPVVGDFAGPKALRAIGDYVRERGGTVDVFYASNVEPALFEAGTWRTFYDSVLTLPRRDSSVVLRTFFGLTGRVCTNPRPVIRTPVLSPMHDFLTAYQAGEITTQCDLITRSS